MVKFAPDYIPDEFYKSPSYKARHMFRTNCMKHFLSWSSVGVFPDALVSNYCINGIASYRIAYKIYIVQARYTAQP